MTIEIGERIDYQRAIGPRHLACADRAGRARRNKYPTKCHLCGHALKAAQGALNCIETQDESGAYRRRWVASCVDVEACRGRL